uniref:Transglutaminase-like domain-containing protein n=1 Tax=Strigamia maritima TaxID=126957 RepID=T1J480_STRMM
MASNGRVVRQHHTAEGDKFDQQLIGKAQKAIDRHDAEEKKIKTQRKTTKEDSSSADKLQKVDAVEFYVPSNAVEHHTKNYEFVQLNPPVPVFRRGQTFYLAVRFKGTVPFDQNNDTLKLVFSFGPRPNIARGTQAEVHVKFDSTSDSSEKNNLKWEAIVQHHEGTILTLHINIPPFAPVDDAVYMEDEKWRKECILNEFGKVYMGTHSSPKGRSWLYGQFDDVVLPACLLLLDRANLDYDSRGDPTHVVRGISAVVNSRDDDGLLVDNWSGDYSGGTSPMDWTGSLKIFEEFVKSGGKSVKFGQCWVYSGCVTTFCRALGIPCRSTTNYVSAHDCHQNLTVDKFYDCNGELKTDFDDQDVIWNFHVWNEVWMSRPDLPTGYGGWQIIDATPQELSEGSYRLGPASVMAVRKGEIGLQYDTMFVISEVNADIIHWKDDEESEIGLRQMKSNNYFIGKKILTKAPEKYTDSGIGDALDIIGDYKNPEGSKEERLQLLNAARNARLWYLYDTPAAGTEDVEFDLLDIDKIMIGEPFHVTVKIQNKSKQKRSIFAVLTATSIYYTGISYDTIKKEKKEFVLRPQQSETLTLEVKADEYIHKLVDYSMIKICATASVQETRQSWAEEDDFSVEKPSVQINFLTIPAVNKPLKVQLTFQNPLPYPLECCKFSYEGTGLSRPKMISFKDVAVDEKVIYEETLLPQHAGECKIVTTFSSKQLKELSGSATVHGGEAAFAHQKHEK